MKKRLLPLVLSLLLGLAACGEAAPQAETAPAVWEPFAYTLTAAPGFSHETLAEDGTAVCSCRHEIPQLLPADGLTAAQQVSVDAFHNAMDRVLAGSRLLYDELARVALEDYGYLSEVGLEWPGCYTDEMTYTAWCGERAVALDFAGYTYLGGPHPGVGNVCYLFDLEQAEMVGLAEITDDGGAAFRDAVGGEILRQIEEQGLAEQYYDDYAATAMAQDEVEYSFREGSLTAYFPNYTLGPYAAGYPSFEIPAEVYADALNARGRALLELS